MQTCARTLKKIMIPIAVASTVLLAGCDKGEAPPQSREPVVSVVTVGTQSLTLTNEMPGRTVPYRIAEIRPQVNGIILERLFEEGSQVEKGQILYRIDPAPYQAALDNAEANLVAIQLRMDRFADLLPDHAVSQQDYDDAVAGVKSWQAQVRAARINIDYTNITAPITGRIGRSNVTEGAIVTAYQPMYLATIQQLDPIYVDIPQSTAEVQRLRREFADGTLNQSGTGKNIVRLVEEDGVPYPLEGTLQFRDISVDPTTGSVILRAVFPNPNGVLLPQMFVRAIVNEGVTENAILVPQQGVSRDPKGDPFAWIVDAESKAQIRGLVLDRAVGDNWLVTEGLTPGDQLIVEGLQSLRRPGTRVQVVPFDQNAGHGAASGGSPAGPNGGSEKQSTHNTAKPE